MEKNTFDDNTYIIDINRPYTYDNYTPDKLYQALAHNIKWAYPQYTTDADNNISIINSLEFTDAVTTADNNTINAMSMPYNLAYSIYPRILYNDEEQMNIILMLRRPSVQTEETYSVNNNEFTKDIINPLNVLN